MLKKCPICELNYLRGDETMCRVCAAERSKKRAFESKEDEDEIILCSECGEKPALPGHELCEDCLKEQKRQANLEVLADKIRADEAEDPLEEDISDTDEEE